MWEAIASNRQRSLMLIGLMGMLLVALGAVIGAALVPPAGNHYLDPGHRGGGVDPLVSGAWGAGIALTIWLILWLVAVAGGDDILLSAAGAKRVDKEHAPQLWNVVEEMTIASGLGKVPRVYLIEDDNPNAFAVGYKPGKAAVAVTTGLLRRLNRDELQGVVAHEIGHIRNMDVRFLTIAGVMMGSIVLIADLFLRSLWYGSGRRSSRSSRGGGQAQLILLVVAIVLAIAAPLLAQILYFACSRKREYLADASAARFTRYPAGLASALEKISTNVGRSPVKGARANRVVAPMFIVNPLQARGAVGLLATHPPTEKRIRILRSMGGGAGLAEYEAAYQREIGQKEHCLGERTLREAEAVAIREPSVTADERADAVARAREAGDLAAGLANFLFIACVCGLRIKVPPDFKRSEIKCPRCGREHEVPVAELAVVTAAAGAVRQGGKKAAKPTPPAPQSATIRYKRKGGGWESFKCRCGHPIQLSPGFRSPTVTCPKCRAVVSVDSTGR
ncbi:MAG: M48 family metallopeptidase [Phycisphaerae bacterium]|jgi:heat shock protein HtpX